MSSCVNRVVNDVKEKTGISGPSKKYANPEQEVIHAVQMQRINDTLVRLTGSPYFEFRNVEDYLDHYLRSPEIGRTGDIDLEKDPITPEEGLKIIRSLQRFEAMFRDKNAARKGFEDAWLTARQRLMSSPRLSAVFNEFNNDLERAVKAKTTAWNRIIDGEKAERLEYEDNEEGNPNPQTAKRKSTANLEDLLGFNTEIELDANTARKFFGRIISRKVKLSRVLNVWAQLEVEAADQFELVTVVDEKGDKTTKRKNVSDPKRQAKAKEKLNEFQRIFQDEIAYSQYVFDILEEKENTNEPPARLRKNLKPKAAIETYKSLMDDIYVFELDTYNKFFKDNEKLRKFFLREAETILRKKNIGKDEKWFKKRLARLEEMIFDRKPPNRRKNYVPHYRSERYVLNTNNIMEILSDLEGDVNIDALLSYQSDNSSWKQRVDPDGATVIKNPFLAAQQRIMLAIQTRKMAGVRNFYTESIDILEKERKRIEDLNEKEVIANNETFQKQGKALIDEYDRAEKYIRLLASDASGIPRVPNKGWMRFYQVVFRTKDKKTIARNVQSMSRIYRSLKTSAYLGFGIKQILTNMQQSVAPLQIEFGWKYMKDAWLKGEERQITLEDGRSERFNIPDLVGVRYDDILSLAEGDIPAIMNDVDKSGRFQGFLSEWEKKSQRLANFSLSHSIFGTFLSFTKIEWQNRARTAMAAYDWKSDQLRNSGRNISAREIHNIAIKFARREVDKLQFDYNIINRSQALRSNWGAATFMFKSFAVNQTQLQFDWFYDAKNSIFVNKKDSRLNVDWKRIAPLVRFIGWRLASTVTAGGAGWKVGLLAIESPLMDYLTNLYMVLMGEEPEEAFYGQGLWGMVSFLLTGTGSDLTSLLIIMTSDDEDLVERTKQNVMLGYTPGGTLYRTLVGTEDKPKVLRSIWENVYNDEDINTYGQMLRAVGDFLTLKYDFNFGE